MQLMVIENDTTNLREAEPSGQLSDYELEQFEEDDPNLSDIDVQGIEDDDAELSDNGYKDKDDDDLFDELVDQDIQVKVSRSLKGLS